MAGMSLTHLSFRVLIRKEKADEQKNAVKALLNGEALTHPDHPLHQAGQDGIELYISELSLP